MKKLVNGIEVELTQEEIDQRIQEEAEWKARQILYEQTESYKDKRRAEYPPIGDQLDALYKAMDTGVLPQVKGFYDKIKIVKEKHRKPV